MMRTVRPVAKERLGEAYFKVASFKFRTRNIHGGSRGSVDVIWRDDNEHTQNYMHSTHLERTMLLSHKKKPLEIDNTLLALLFATLKNLLSGRLYII